MFENLVVIWSAIIFCIVTIFITSIVLAGMYDNLKARVKNLER